jgi:hypothetical protein
VNALKFSGSTEDLKAITSLLHLDGHWVHEGLFDLFRLESGEAINFWPSTGEIRVNGHPGAAAALSRRLQALIDAAVQA